MNTKIDFILPGFPKCGTTWLYKQLSLLPEFSMPYFKEIHYFDRSLTYDSTNFLNITSKYERIFNKRLFKRNIQGLARVGYNIVKLDFDKSSFLYKWYFENYTDSWYFSLFPKSDGIKGDITPTYCLLDDEDVSKMAKLLPENIKIIFVLRDPIERAWSQYRMMLGKDFSYEGNSLSTKKGMENFLVSKREISRASYLVAIARFKKYFPRSKIMITFFDVLQKDPHRFLSNIVTFLEGEPKSIFTLPELKKRIHVSSQKPIPAEAKIVLKKQYEPLMRDLMDTYGGYCEEWYKNLEAEVTFSDMISHPSHLII